METYGLDLVYPLVGKHTHSPCNVVECEYTYQSWAPYHECDYNEPGYGWLDLRDCYRHA